MNFLNKKAVTSVVPKAAEDVLDCTELYINSISASSLTPTGLSNFVPGLPAYQGPFWPRNLVPGSRGIVDWGVAQSYSFSRVR